MSKFTRALGALALFLFAFPALAQSPVGTWRTFEDGQPKSIVRITESGGTLSGAIVNLLPEGRLCVDCKAYPSDGPVASQRGRATANTDMRGFVILTGFSDANRDGKWDGGRAFKPDEGKMYSGWMQVQPDGRLRLTGGYRILGRVIGKTQYWERIR